jgi:sugar phosphate permease
MKASYKVGLALIFCYLVAWLDRMAINMTIPFIAKDLDIGPERVGWILSAFFLGYSVFQIPGGMLADRFGPRRVILVALSWWSVFTALTGAVFSLPSMLVTRFFFGVGEGIFPASVWKVLGNWFTKKNRATANAIIISSIALGPALTPLMLAPVLEAFGWRTCFYLLGMCGVVCVVVAHLFVSNSIREGRRVPPEELAEFEADERSQAANAEASLEKASFGALLKTPIIWVLFSITLTYTLTMYGWLNWLPTYLMKSKNLDLRNMAVAASVPFMFAAVGCMTAGWVSDRWFRGRRRFLVFICQVVGGLCLYGFTRVEDYTAYMALQCAAGFLLFMGSGAVWTLPMILLPTKLMGSGSGFINTGGQIGGFLSSIVIGYVIAWRNNDYAAGFDVMLVSLGVAAVLVLFGVREHKATPAPPPPVPEPA